MGADPYSGLSSAAERVMEETVYMVGRVLLADNGTNTGSLNGLGPTKFNPSMAIIIIVLIGAFFFMGFFSLYVRKCSSAGNQELTAPLQRPMGGPTEVASQGLDRSIVNALPLVGYSIVKGLKETKDSVECAVCLSEFEEDETLRLLPECGHLFHPECIDMWFFSHSTCPLCRMSLVGSPDSLKEAQSGYSQEFANWVAARGLSDSMIIRIRGENGMVHELQTAEEDVGGENHHDCDHDHNHGDPVARSDSRTPAEQRRALNRALSRNSQSFRKAARTMEVSERLGHQMISESARFHPSTVAGALNGTSKVHGSAFFENRKRAAGSTQEAPADLTLRRSSSAGSSGRYFRELFGQNYTDMFSPEFSEERLKIDRAKLLSEHRTRSAKARFRADRNDRELHNITGDDRNLELAETGECLAGSASSTGLPPLGKKKEGRSIGMSGELSRMRGELMRGRSTSGELHAPFPYQQMEDPEGDERTGPMYHPRLLRKSGELASSTNKAEGEASAKVDSGGDYHHKSDRWNFPSLRSFSLRRTLSDGRDLQDSLSGGSTLNQSDSRSGVFPSLWPSSSRIKRTVQKPHSRRQSEEQGQDEPATLNQIVTEQP